MTRLNRSNPNQQTDQLPLVFVDIKVDDEKTLFLRRQELATKILEKTKKVEN